MKKLIALLLCLLMMTSLLLVSCSPDETDSDGDCTKHVDKNDDGRCDNEGCGKKYTDGCDKTDCLDTDNDGKCDNENCDKTTDNKPAPQMNGQLWASAFDFANVTVHASRPGEELDIIIIGDKAYEIEDGKCDGADDSADYIPYFDFSGSYALFTLKDDGTYFCESYNAILEDDVFIASNVIVDIKDGRVASVKYDFDMGGITVPFTYTFSDYGTTSAPEIDNGKITLTVTVVDKNNNPVIGTKVQICKEGEACQKPVSTDENGVVSFEVVPGVYYASFPSNPDAKYYFGDKTDIIITVEAE